MVLSWHSMKRPSPIDSYRSRPCTYSVQIPNSDGSGTVDWSYTVSTALPPPHPNNPSYPPWTGLSRLIQRRIETLAFVCAITGDSTYLSNADGYGALDTALAVASWSQWTDPGYSCGGRTCRDTAHLTMGLAMVYDLAFDAMTQAERDQLRNAFEPGDMGPAEMVLHGNVARLQAFLVSSSAMKSGFPSVQWHPGAEEYGPYAEWRTSSTRALRLAAALVPGQQPHSGLANPGFEDGLAN